MRSVKPSTRGLPVSRIVRLPRDRRREPREAALRAAQQLERDCAKKREGRDAIDRAHGEQLATLSHDLRNPLSVILASVRLLGRVVASDGSAKRHVDAIARASDELNQILYDVTDWLQIDEGRLALRVTKEDPVSLTERAITAARPHADPKGVEVRIEIAPDVGPLLCDRERITRAIMTLTSNAIRFTPRGGTITVRVESTEAGTRFSVSDTGPGIPEAEQALVFGRPFEPKSIPARGQRARATQGTGMAVWVTRGVVEAHGGCVESESELGGGTTLSFTLPREFDSDAPAGAPDSPTT